MIPQVVQTLLWGLLVFAISVVVIASFMRIVPKGHMGVKFRLGRATGEHKPGRPALIIPFVERMVAVDMSPSDEKLPPGIVIRNKDGLRYSVTGTYKYQIVDAFNALTKVASDPGEAMHNAIRDGVAGYVEKHSLAHAAKQTKELNKATQQAANAVLRDEWYVELSAVNVMVRRQK